jgi:uncharacterized membrane protein
VACYIPLESSWQDFSLELTLIRGLHTKLWTSKVEGVLILRILGLSLGNLGTKWHLGASPMARKNIYYKGEGDGFPQVRTVVSFVSLCLPVVCPCTKKCSNSALTNLLFSLCKSVWIIELLVVRFSPIMDLQHGPLPEVLQAKERAPTISPSDVVTFGLTVESLKELGGASMYVKILIHTNTLGQGLIISLPILILSNFHYFRHDV